MNQLLNVKKLPSAKDIQKRVNERFDALFYKSKHEKERYPYVCVVCDRFIIKSEDLVHLDVEYLKKARSVLQWDTHEDERRTREIEEHFRVDERWVRFHFKDLKDLALSPRAPFYYWRNSDCFSCCTRCSGNLKKPEPTLPRHAIINSNYVGAAPSCLMDLTEPELAFITPLKHYGYCFSFTGGKQKCLKGTMSFMRVSRKSIAKAVATLERSGLNDNVLILYSGRLTKWQQKRAKELCSVRTDKIIAAIEWLIANNGKWKDVDKQSLVDKLNKTKPVVVDKSEEVESENSNIEEQEVFTCYYPDGAATPTNGGCEDPNAFKKYVVEMAQKGYDVEFQANLQKEFVKDLDGDLLVDNNVLQFPYGIGGLNDRRELQDGSYTTKSDLDEFLQNLSLQSQSQFQRPLFQLMLYSMICKNWLLRSSRLQLRGKTDAENLASGLNQKDVISCINGRRMRNRRVGTNVSKLLLDAVDATAAQLPHTNEAAKRARASGEAMQHHFGMGSVFLTCTFDDENSLVMEVLSRKSLGHDKKVEDLTDQEVIQMANDRRTLRIEHPGLAALNFEMLLQILMEEVIGWDCKANRPKKTNKDERVKGYFGDVEAMSYAVEEQGRKTLHVHMTLWINTFKDIQWKYFFGNDGQKRAAESRIKKYAEHVGSTELFPLDSKDHTRVFEHECSEPRLSRKPPDTLSRQDLRAMRNKRRYKESGGIFAICPHPKCKKTWTYEDLMLDFLNKCDFMKVCHPTSTSVGTISKPKSKANGSECVTGEPESQTNTKGSESQRFTGESKIKNAIIPKARMKATIIDYQKGNREEPPKTCINAVYQHHVSCHVKGCFRCQKEGNKKRKHVCGPNCECRFRLPDAARPHAEIFVNKENMDWYLWNGDCRKQPIAQVCPKRRKFDLFQNTSCPAISHSKFSCNNNVSVILDGPIGQYQHKYQEKGTQNDDTADYKEVEATIRNFDCERRHEDDRPEALRRICRAAFAHNKRNVISPCFASYLVRNKTRFYHSHQFKYCPLRDVIRLHNREEIGGFLKYSQNGTQQFFENAALDYLCRHAAMEEITLAQFTEDYCTVYVPKNAKEGIYQYQAATKEGEGEDERVLYRHPSVITEGDRKGTCARGATERDESILFRVNQWMFPDTASFGCNIFTCPESELNGRMDEYAHLVLALFKHHRKRDDLRSGTSFPYVRKLREVFQEEQGLEDHEKAVLTKKNMQILQNIQNCRSNTLRYKITDDPLSHNTSPYMSTHLTEEDEESDDEDPELSHYEQFMDFFMDEDEQTSYDQKGLKPKLQGFKFEHMRNLGKDRCGYNIDIPPPKIEYKENFVNKIATPRTGRTDDNCPMLDTERKHYKCDDIVRLIIGKRSPKENKLLWENDIETKEINVSDATGSARSIREWAKAAFENDDKQRRAFEVLTASFVLTFYEESPENKHDDTELRRTEYELNVKNLKKLRGINPKARNLICLLHGPGGSGKSTVINTVKAYAMDYCKNLEHPYTSCRTLVITAMSGVAATLLNGETTHSVLGLNRSNIDPSDTSAWIDARLLIVDECSFASASDFEKMQEHLKILMGNHFDKYGGINIVFAGDFCQLEPVQKEPVYKDGKRCPEFHGSLNCYIELDGKHRFKNDPRFGEIMFRMRNGHLTDQDLKKLNTRVRIVPPPKTQVATYTNKDRDAINAAIFDRCTRDNAPQTGTLKSACMILMDEIYMNDSKKNYVPVLNDDVLRYFYENCTEDECSYNKKTKKGRIDPVLKLYHNCPMMLTQNKDVASGEANGSRVLVQEIKLKRGEDAFHLKLNNGTTILAAFASQVDRIRVKHESEKITPSEFDVEAEQFTFITRIQDRYTSIDRDMFVTMKGTQFPLISNSCTTGHKLQGCSVDNILINSWNYGSNWVYVVLSRVRTIEGLHLRKALAYDLSKYTPDKDMLEMLKYLDRRCSVKTLSRGEYKRLDQKFS